MDHHEDTRETHVGAEAPSESEHGESHATTGGAAAAGAVTGGIIGLASPAGPIGAAIGAIGGAIVGAVSERLMHADDHSDEPDTGLIDDHGADATTEGGAVDTSADRGPLDRQAADSLSSEAAEPNAPRPPR